MNNSTWVRISAGVLALLASVLLIVAANITIADFMPTFGSTMNANTMVVLAYCIIVIAIISKLCAIVMMTGKASRYMAIGVILSQIALIALEITSYVLWTNIAMVVSVLDIIFMVASVLAIIMAVVFLVKHAHIPESQPHSY